MVSNVDPTKPTQGRAYTADVRKNFATIKAEIESLQSSSSSDSGGHLPISGGTLTGTLRVESNLGEASSHDIEIVSTSPDLPIPPMLKLYSSYGGGTIFAGPFGGLAIGSIDDNSGVLSQRLWALEVSGNDLLLNAPGYTGNVVRGAGGNQIVFNAKTYGFYGATQFFVATPMFSISGMPTVAQTDTNTLWNNNGVVNIGAGAMAGTALLEERIVALENKIASLEASLAQKGNS
jgi:hypothetical protein